MSTAGLEGRGMSILIRSLGSSGDSGVSTATTWADGRERRAVDARMVSLAATFMVACGEGDR